MNKTEKYKYQNDFNKLNYDRLNIQVQKGKKEVITNHYKSKGFKSLNEYINFLIAEDMKASQ